MKNPTKLAVVLLVFGLSAFAAYSYSQDASLETIMQRKLDHAHVILEALIFEDYEALEESAAILASLSEEAGWFVLQTPEYTNRSAAFRLAANEIEESAKERNLEGAALGYVEMTLKCVQCHDFLRGTRTAGDYSPAVGDNPQLQALRILLPPGAEDAKLGEEKGF